MHLTPSLDTPSLDTPSFDTATFSSDVGAERTSSTDPVQAIVRGEDGAMDDEFDVVDATGAQRFELRRAGELVGFAPTAPVTTPVHRG